MLEKLTNNMWKKILNLVKNPLFVLCLILILGLVLRLLDINKTSFWYDEAFTGDILKLSWKEMFAVIAADKVHPPLFYILIRLWSVIFGITQFSLRSFSVFCGLGTIGLAYIVGKEFFNKNKFPILGIVLAFVIAISPFFVTYSVEARAYSFLAFLALGLAYTVVKFLDSVIRKEKIKYLILAIVLSIILCCTHYLQIVYVIAVLCAGIIYKLVFTEKSLNKKWLLASLSVAVAIVLVLIFVPVKQFVERMGISGMWWIPDIKWYELVRVYYSYFLGVVRYAVGVPPVRDLIVSIPTLLFGGIMFGIHLLGYIYILVSKKIEREEKRKITFFFFLPIITFIGFYILGLLGFNCFVERYTIAGGLILFLSYWMVLYTCLKKWSVLIPLSIYVAFICMLLPSQLPIDYRILAKELDNVDNVKRYIFVSPTDLIDSQFYMSHTNVYYYYDFKEEYPGWALLNDSVNGIYAGDIKQGDLLIVSIADTQKYLDLGYTKSLTIGNDFSILNK